MLIGCSEKGINYSTLDYTTLVSKAKKEGKVVSLGMHENESKREYPQSLEPYRIVENLIIQKNPNKNTDEDKITKQTAKDDVTDSKMIIFSQSNLVESKRIIRFTYHPKCPLSKDRDTLSPL